MCKNESITVLNKNKTNKKQVSIKVECLPDMGLVVACGISWIEPDIQLYSNFNTIFFLISLSNRKDTILYIS